MESNFALASCISAPQALKQWIKGHTAAVNNLKAANAHVAECNRGKQKLVDAEKKAKTSLATEKEKTKKLSKEVASLKKQLKQKNKGKKAARMILRTMRGKNLPKCGRNWRRPTRKSSDWRRC